MNDLLIKQKIKIASDLSFCIGLLEGLAITQDNNFREWFEIIIEKLANVRKEMQGE
jgi:hypothetical protein